MILEIFNETQTDSDLLSTIVKLPQMVWHLQLMFRSVSVPPRAYFRLCCVLFRLPQVVFHTRGTPRRANRFVQFSPSLE